MTQGSRRRVKESGCRGSRIPSSMRPWLFGDVGAAGWGRAGAGCRGCLAQDPAQFPEGHVLEALIDQASGVPELDGEGEVGDSLAARLLQDPAEHRDPDALVPEGRRGPDEVDDAEAPAAVERDRPRRPPAQGREEVLAAHAAPLPPPRGPGP